MKSIFVTATGTDVGKTYISALLVKAMRDAGVDARYYKPALSGAVREGERLIPGDAAFVAECAGLQQQPEQMVSYIFEEAVSPHLAAKRSGAAIELEKLADDRAKAVAAAEFLLVEGCGGLICPLRRDDQSLMLADVAERFGDELLLVAPAGLGSINAAVLTVEYAKQRGLTVRGIVLNGYEAGNFLHEDNRQEIEALTGLPVLATVAWGAKQIDLNLAQL